MLKISEEMAKESGNISNMAAAIIMVAIISEEMALKKYQ